MDVNLPLSPSRSLYLSLFSALRFYISLSFCFYFSPTLQLPRISFSPSLSRFLLSLPLSFLPLYLSLFFSFCQSIPSVTSCRYSCHTAVTSSVTHESCRLHKETYTGKNMQLNRLRMATLMLTIY